MGVKPWARAVVLRRRRRQTQNETGKARVRPKRGRELKCEEQGGEEKGGTKRGKKEKTSNEVGGDGNAPQFLMHQSVRLQRDVLGDLLDVEVLD